MKTDLQGMLLRKGGSVEKTKKKKGKMGVESCEKINKDKGGLRKSIKSLRKGIL